MNYAELTKKILPKVMAIVALINNPEVLPEVRQRNHEILFATLGDAIYTQVYDMAAFDFDIEHTTGRGIDRRHYGLAKLASGSISTGGALEAIVAEYLAVVADQAQGDAFTTARESGKHPTVTRSIVSETCDWCEAKAGTWTNPDPEVFMRHENCDCKIVTSGYKSRNGLLENYVKPKDR